MYDRKQKTKTTNTIKLRLNIYYIKMCANKILWTSIEIVKKHL